MNAQVNSAAARLPRLRLLWVLGAALALWACGDDDDSGGVDTSTDRDAGSQEDGGGFEFDGSLEPLPRPDAGRPFPGDPPLELADSPCAVDTNKLYDVVTLDRPAAPVQLAVDRAQSRFGAAFIGDSDQCIDALYLANLQGASGVGEPEVTLISDACTTVTHAAIVHAGGRWLMAIVDARMATYDIWLQAYDGRDEFAPRRLSDNAAHESDVQLALVGDAEMDTQALMAVWVERDPDSGASALLARPVSLAGEPAGDPVVLEPAGTWSFGSVALGGIGRESVALAYRRSNAEGASEIVLDVLAIDTGERVRDSWVLTSEAGELGTVELGIGRDGGGVIYSIGQIASQQLWFQALDQGGRAAPVRVGNQLGGPSSPMRVVGPPHRALDVSLVKLASGYAVSYRALPGGTVDSPRIRVHFLDRAGVPQAASDVALASEFGGRTAIEAGADGRIVLGWTDAAEDGTSTLTVVKLPCVGN